jgi:hypothetical protein
MMKTKKLYILIAVFTCFLSITRTFSNINAIDFSKTHLTSQEKPLVTFLQNNVGLYDHWVHNWAYPVPKDVAVKNLTSLYDHLEKLDNKNLEDDLLAGDVAHFLYNMELDTYYEKAVDNYNKAMRLSPNDYRVYWFLGNHYALSNNPIKAIQNYATSLKLSTGDPGGYFWFDYAFATFTAGMPSTSRYAIEHSVKDFGKADKMSSLFIEQLKKASKVPVADTTIAIKDMWSVTGRDQKRIVLVNRVAGIRVAIDSTWVFQPTDYTKNGEGIPIQPPTIISKKNNEPIGYSILVLAKIPQPNQSLSDFIAIFTQKNDVIKPVKLTDRYKNSIAYDIVDTTIYKNIGGGHMYMIAIERDEPAYPGMALEQADNSLSKGEVGKVNYYNVRQKFTRLKGKLYYLVLLDSCEYIHDESLAVFKDFLENGLVIE